MYSPSDLIAALQGRVQRRLSLRGRAQAGRAPGEFPPGWQAWFDSMRVRVGAVTGVAADAIVAILLARELRARPQAGADLTRWQTFATLWRTSWEPPERESRKDRVAAWATTLFVHLFILVLWAWLLYVSVPVAPPPPAGDDSSAVRVVFIGEGTPEDTGGGAPAGELPDARQAAAPAAAPAPQVEPTPAPEVPSVAEAQPEPEQPAPSTVPQPLQVSEPVQPQPDFELPPTTPPELEIAPAPRPQVVVVPRQRDVELVEQPVPPQLRTEIRPQPIDVPVVPPQERQVRQREVTAVVTPRDIPELTRPLDAPAPRVEAPEVAVRIREIVLEPSADPGAQSPVPAAGGERAQTDASEPVTGGVPDNQGGTPQQRSAGTGATPAAPSGAWLTPTRGDDWGEALRSSPGGNPGSEAGGLYGADGRPRLPPGTAQPGGGFPPGSDNWTQDLLDRHGTWARRPPLGYEPTRFDRYWIPSGSLLQEWVRRGIRSLDIPLPGSTKTIRCTVSILQLGGGCGISDANLQDQEAIARPPPDIPFKRELQEDNGSN